VEATDVFERLGSWTYRFRFLIVLGWIVAGGLMAAFAPSLAGSGTTDQPSFLPASAPSVAAHDAIERAFPRSTAKSLLEAADRFQPLDRKFMIRTGVETRSPSGSEEAAAASPESERVEEPAPAGHAK